jgi:GST-like protein
MIDLYYWPTPNGHKITMFLEEAGLEYRIRPVDISAGDQFDPAFLAVSPNNRMPAIVDHAPADGGEPVGVFESGAILIYLGDKTGKLTRGDLRGRKTVMEWLFWQVGGLGPMAGQNHHFSLYAPQKITYAIERYVNETNRLYGVLDRRLADRPFVAGDDYTIAAAAEPRRVPTPAPLVRWDPRSARDGPGLCEGRAVLEPARGYRARQKDPIRTDRCVGGDMTGSSAYHGAGD